MPNKWLRQFRPRLSDGSRTAAELHTGIEHNQALGILGIDENTRLIDLPVFPPAASVINDFCGRRLSGYDGVAAVQRRQEQTEKNDGGDSSRWIHRNFPKGLWPRTAQE